MKRVITVQDVPASGELRVPIGTIITPSAREVAAGRGMRVEKAADDPAWTRMAELGEAGIFGDIPLY